ncbi:MAG: hypothetical protein ACYDFR_04800 [Candidatus Omnitrophota bacterium]
MINKNPAKIVFIVLIIFFSLYIFKYIYFLKCANITYNKSWEASVGMDMLDEKQRLMLGWGVGREDVCSTSYINYPISKPPGIIRVGIFGGSRAVCGGKSTITSFDYPTLLHNRFKESGIKNVEIINFGVNSYGFFQEYMLWDFLGKSYDLDYVIMSISDIPWVRDLVFYTEATPSLHARFLIKNNKLTLMPAVGDTRFGAYRNYYKIPPPFRYILYDKNIPVFLKILLPRALHNQINPFYYRRFVSQRLELYPIYASILNSISGRVKNLIVLAENKDIRALRARVYSQNVYFYEPQANNYFKSFILVEPKNIHNYEHPNRLGNQLIADELFSLLTGDLRPKFYSIKLLSNFTHKNVDHRYLNQPISNYENISIKNGYHFLADFTTLTGKSFFRQGGFGIDNENMVIWSLLMLNTDDPVFIPLEFPLNNNDKVFLVFERGGEEKKIPIGIVESSVGVFGQMLLNRTICQISNVQNKSEVELVINDKNLSSAIGRTTRLYIMVSEKKILITKQHLRSSISNWIGIFFRDKASTYKFALTPSKLELAYLSSKFEIFFNDDILSGKENTLDLALRNRDGREERIPVFLYKLVQAETVPFKNIYKPLISQSETSVTHVK